MIVSNNLLESLWARVDTNIGARIKQISELLTQALSANAESVGARDIAVAAEQTATTAATNAASSEAAAKSAESSASSHAQSAQASATSSLSAAERAEFAAEETIQQVEGDFATRNYVDSSVANALRVDTTVGTRLFFGEHMIYGDTGPRRIDNLATGVDTEEAHHFRIVLRRVGDTVTLYGIGRSTGARELVEGIPQGFICTMGEFRGSLGVLRLRSGDAVHLIGNNSRSSEIRIITRIPAAGDLVDFTAEWHTDNAWPSSLPGTPL